MHLQARRQRCINTLPDDTLIVLPSRPPVRRNGDCDYPYRQDSNMWYLSGYSQPHACFLLQSQAGQWRSGLWIKQPSAKEARWHGPTPSLETLKQDTQVDHVAPLDNLAQDIKTWLNGIRHLWMLPGQDAWLPPEWRANIQNHPALDTQSLPQQLMSWRSIKDSHEIACIRHAIAASTHAHHTLMRAGTPGRQERDLASTFDFEVRRQGCEDVAYPSIIASGQQACILHYHTHHATLQPGDCVLVDAGGEYQGYAADISRTWPCSGRFTSQQRDAYNLVLAVQQSLIAQLQPGRSWRTLQDLAREQFRLGCIDLGLCSPSQSEDCVRRWFCHSFGHELGLDVHDGPADYGQPLESGMVITVEPGLYLDDPSVPDTWRGLGIRIEDDILITDQGCEVLSESCYKTPEEIETWIQQHRH